MQFLPPFREGHRRVSSRDQTSPLPFASISLRKPTRSSPFVGECKTRRTTQYGKYRSGVFLAAGVLKSHRLPSRPRVDAGVTCRFDRWKILGGKLVHDERKFEVQALEFEV